MYASISGVEAKNAVAFVSTGWSLGTASPRCANLKKERLTSLLTSLSLVSFSIVDSASTAVRSAIRPRENTTARSVSLPLPACSLRQGTSAGEESSIASPDWRNCSIPLRIASSWDFFFAKGNFLCTILAEGSLPTAWSSRSVCPPDPRRRSSARFPLAHRGNSRGTTWRARRRWQTRPCHGSWRSE